jgi:hypothetical protein
MISKTHVVLFVFLVMIMSYFVYALYSLVKTHDSNLKRELFEAETSEKKEAFSDKQLDMNLFVINTFEDVHDRKIKTNELKKLTDAFSQGNITTKDEMKKKIEEFKEEAPAKDSGDSSMLSKLKALSAQVNQLIAEASKSDNPTVVTSTIEKFQARPYSKESVFMDF